MLTKQEIIDKINTDFNGQAMEGSSGQCMYKLTDKSGQCKKCAIGLFIPDGHKGQEELMSVDELLGCHPDLWDSMPIDNIDFLTAFQEVHDDSNMRRLSVDEQKSQLIGFVDDNYTTTSNRYLGE
jgi:hypothetical protein